MDKVKGTLPETEEVVGPEQGDEINIDALKNDWAAITAGKEWAPVTQQAPLKSPMTSPTSDDISQLVMALAKVQGEIKDAKKDSTNPMYGSSYASLSSCLSACREALKKNNIALIQPARRENGITVRTILLLSTETGAQWIAEDLSSLPGRRQKGEKVWSDAGDYDIHAMSGVITYLRRYQLCAMLGFSVDGDDDGVKVQQSGMGKKGIDKKYIVDGVVIACPFGKNEGVMWTDMNERQLAYYATKTSDALVKLGAQIAYSKMFGATPDA